MQIAVTQVINWCSPISASMVPTVCRKVCQPTPVMPILLKAGWIFFFNTEAKSSGFFPFSLSEGKTKSPGRPKAGSQISGSQLHMRHLAGRGSFQVGQTTKVRSSYRVQSLR